MFRKNLKLTSYIIAIALILPALLFQACGKSTPPQSVCKVSTIDGTATITRSGGKAEQALKGSKLFAGESISTESKSSVKLQFRDFASIVVGEQSKYAITTQKTDDKENVLSTSTELLKGVGLVSVDPSKKTKFAIKTPHVITGVLGTQFGLEVDSDCDDDGKDDEGETTLGVLNGLVSFEGSGEKLEIGAGSGAHCKGKEKPEKIDNFFKKQSKLSKHLTNFVKEEAIKGTNLKSIFRSY